MHLCNCRRGCPRNGSYGGGGSENDRRVETGGILVLYDGQKADRLEILTKLEVFRIPHQSHYLENRVRFPRRALGTKETAPGVSPAEEFLRERFIDNRRVGRSQ